VILAPSLKRDLLVGLGTTIPAGSSIIEPMFVSVRDAAVVLALSAWTIRDMLKRGVLTAKKSGRRTLVTMESIRAHAEGLPDAVLGHGPPVKAAIEGQRRRRAKAEAVAE
jgi:excisionase family DNA binding protein